MFKRGAGSKAGRLYRRERRPRWQRACGYFSLVIALLLAGTLVYAFVDYNHLNGEVSRPFCLQTNADCHNSPVGPPPKKHVIGAQNWLIMGSDSRNCKGCQKYGKSLVNGGARSDTTILAHLSRGGTSATLVSIPRDSYVQIPACKQADGSMSSPQMQKFNAAFEIGGPACTIKTVQQLTGIPIDHFIVINFDGFKNIVDALGGVQVCLRHSINDKVRYDPLTGGDIGSGLVAHKGVNTFNGKEALAFVRSRYAVGDGSDLDRIKDQQAFISAMLRQVESAGLLLDVPKLNRVAQAVVKSLTVDQGLSLNDLVNFMHNLHSLPPAQVNFVTVPLKPGSENVSIDGYIQNVIEWDPAKSTALWQALQNDVPLPGTLAAKNKQPAPSSSSPSPSPSSTLIVPPSEITVNVLNGTSQNNLAHKVATQLQQLGFNIGTIGDAPSPSATTIVQYGPSKVQTSQTLAASIDGGATRQEDSSLTDSVNLIVGSNFTGVQAVTISTASPDTSSSASVAPPKNLGITNAKRDVCAIG